MKNDGFPFRNFECPISWKPEIDFDGIFYFIELAKIKWYVTIFFCLVSLYNECLNKNCVCWRFTFFFLRLVGLLGGYINQRLLLMLLQGVGVHPEEAMDQLRVPRYSAQTLFRETLRGVAHVSIGFFFVFARLAQTVRSIVLHVNFNCAFRGARRSLIYSRIMCNLGRIGPFDMIFVAPPLMHGLLRKLTL